MEEKYIFIVFVLYTVLKAVVPNIIAKTLTSVDSQEFKSAFSINIEHFFIQKPPHVNTLGKFFGDVFAYFKP